MTSVGNLGIVSNYLNNDKIGSTSTALETLNNSSAFGVLNQTSPLSELGVMSSINEPVDLANLAVMATPAGPAMEIMQQLGFPELSDLLKGVGVDKLLDKVPGLNSLTKGIGDVGKSIKDGVGGAVKSATGAVKKVAKKL
ncbi:MAG: hypothetical protein AB1782_07420 [Cyanobacteriota bacterium]